MNHKIKCRAGRCAEDEVVDTDFDVIFAYSNIVDQFMGNS